MEIWYFETENNCKPPSFFVFVPTSNELQSGLKGFAKIDYNSNSGDIVYFFVAEKYRKTGIGTKILNEIERQAKEKGVTCLKFWCLKKWFGFFAKNQYKIKYENDTAVIGEKYLD